MMDLKSVHYIDHSKIVHVRKGLAVQIQEDNQSRFLWKLGNIHSVRDGKARAYTIRMGTGNLIR